MLAAAVLLAACGGGSGSGSGTGSSTAPAGPISAPSGPFLHDAYGRVVIMHGVNLMYKLPPYEIITSGSGTNVLTAREATAIASDGFDVVRLGIFWKGLEPGTAPMNDPAICTPGTPGTAGPEQFNAGIFYSYMSKLVRTIDMLGSYGIYSLIDMHQDALNEVFAGEGFPNWAICTDGITPVAHRNVADWGINDIDPGFAQAAAHFWNNDVVGNLQGAYDQIWSRVAAYLAGNRWVIGYDPINEPYVGSALLNSTAFDAQIQCFYGGRDDPGKDQSGHAITACPPDDPAYGVIPAIESADSHHLVFYEPNTFTNASLPNRIGPLPYPHLVLNFHDYCALHIPNGPEPADYAAVCAPAEKTVVTLRVSEATRDASSFQPGGIPTVMSEFGATTDASDLQRIVSDADSDLVGWMYWQWLHYDDPTGSHDSGLWPAGPATGAQLKVLSEPYAQAVSGTPTSMSFDPATGIFDLSYDAATSITAPTVIFVPVSRHFPNGYCAHATGGSVVSPGDSTHLAVRNASDAPVVTVTVSPGRC